MGVQPVRKDEKRSPRREQGLTIARTYATYFAKKTRLTRQ